MSVNVCANIVGAGKMPFSPKTLNPVFWLKDLTTPINGYWKDYSGKNKQIQAATTTVANDSLIMPANDIDIINALTALGVYSKYYTNNSTPKTVLISQVASIDANYRVFFDSKNKKNFTLFGSAGNEYRADKMYKYTFNAYTGGYFPITQTSDSISFVIRGTGTFVFDWGDGTTNSYTLTTGTDTTISKTWTTNLGGQKNISVTGSIKNWTKLDTYLFNYNECFRISGMNLNFLRVHSNPDIKIVGSITGMTLTFLSFYNCPNINITGSINGMALTSLQLDNCPNINITGSINGMALTFLSLGNTPNINITGSINGMALTFLNLVNCPLISVTGSINGMALTFLSLGNTPNINITGSINGMALTFLNLVNCPLISVTGSINGMALTYLSLYNCSLSNVLGNIETCLVSSTTISVQQQGIIYGGGTLKAWAISITIQASWTSTMVDAFLIAFALVAPAVTGKTLNLAGTNAGRTSASAAAVTTIQNKGFNVLTN